jgi:hypothetical protein
MMTWVFSYQSSLTRKAIEIAYIRWIPPIELSSFKEIRINDWIDKDKVLYEDCWLLWNVIVSVSKDTSTIKSSIYYETLPITWKYRLRNIEWIHPDEALKYRIDCKCILEEDIVKSKL